MKNTLDAFINDRSLLLRALETTQKKYRPFDPGWYLYRKVLEEKDLSNKFTDDFIELVYVTLAAWNMNSRGAKLAEWNRFKRSILAHKENIVRLSPNRLEKISRARLDEILKTDVREMFLGMELVERGKPRLVTYSKTFHFYLPDLFVPIDRAYTLTYFYGHGNLPIEPEKQFARFSDLLHEFRRFASCVNLTDQIDANWNGNIPKVIDNMIIGFQKLHAV